MINTIEENVKGTGILKAIVIINIIVYILTSYENFFIESTQYWVNLFGFIPALIGYPEQWYRILTSMFTHADIFHILFNMYYLYIFGRPIIRIIGGKRFLGLYIFSGLLASIFHTAFSYTGGLTSYVIPAIGASGAISGILGSYLIMYPGTYLIMYSPYIFFPFPIRFRMRAEYYLIFWFATQVLYGYAKIAGTTAVFAHAGGFLAGIAILPVIFTSEMRVRLRPMGYTLTPYIEVEKPRGIGLISKIILSTLIIVLLIGNMYALTTPISGEIKSMIIQYNIDGESYIDYTAVKPPNIETYIRNIATDETRILLNRLTALELLYNIANKNSKINIESLSTQVAIRIIQLPGIYRVQVILSGFNGIYDEDGFISYCEGKLSTQLIVIQGYSVYITSYMVNYEFKITTQTVDLKNITEYMQIPSAIISLTALITLLKKNEELTLMGGEFRGPRLPIPI